MLDCQLLRPTDVVIVRVQEHGYGERVAPDRGGVQVAASRQPTTWPPASTCSSSRTTTRHGVTVAALGGSGARCRSAVGVDEATPQGRDGGGEDDLSG